MKVGKYLKTIFHIFLLILRLLMLSFILYWFQNKLWLNIDLLNKDLR